MKTLQCLGLAALLFLAACQNKNENTDTLVNTFPITEVLVKDTILSHEYVADVHAHRNIEVRARVKGYLDYIFTDEGKAVKAGQLLFKINDEEYKAKYTEARASVNSATAETHAAELEVDRIKMLVDKGVVSDTELRIARSKVEMAQAKLLEAKSTLEQAKINLQHTEIRAPFDGTIDRIPFKIGSLIDEGHLLTTLFDTKNIYAYFKVSEQDYLEYVKSHPDDRNSNEVVFILADGTEHQTQGYIETMESEFDTSTGTIAFRANFSNPSGLIKHGATGKVKLFNRVENALLVPQKATFELQDKTCVFMVDANNKAVLKSFIPKTRIDHYYLVESGLKPGDKIIYEGIQGVRDGMQIKPLSVPGDSLLAKTKNSLPQKIS
ncbi:MAG: efflux RND transporter periplasmic adaptor subunit [Cyclobacteriaceae bacterium]|jgi:membrane fusion protein (multidrug efflux system)|nr:efflux RND transporter periplasmic adaptor subunit [Cyclobacteriaceae bacterium]